LRRVMRICIAGGGNGLPVISYQLWDKLNANRRLATRD
jgi:hypothetical protein